MTKDELLKAIEAATDGRWAREDSAAGFEGRTKDELMKMARIAISRVGRG